MAEKSFSVLNLLDLELEGRNALNLTCLGGRRGLSAVISYPNVTRTGIALTGFFEGYLSNSVQVFGIQEVAYLSSLSLENRIAIIEKILSFSPPCVVFAHGMNPSEEIVAAADKFGCAILKTDLEITEFCIRIMRVFSDVFAPSKTMHGVLLEVCGIGVLLTGHSGVGKSECALELVERGHRLVADDIVEVRCVNGNSILGRGANTLISHHMEIRGLGIINVSQLYGVGSVRDQKEIQLVIQLEEWDKAKVYDRVGTNMETIDFFGVKIPSIEIPVKPGRTLPIIIEAAAMNERLKHKGVDSSRDFNRNILKWIETGEAKSAYYSVDDSY